MPTPQGPLADYQHQHPPVRDINRDYHERLTIGQRVADRVATIVGSWPFILIQTSLLICWIGMNIYFALHPERWKAFDPYPFILLNLALSFQAAYTGPIVMMSQNRQAEKDRMTAQGDYECNLTAEEEIRLIMEHLKYQDALLVELREHLVALRREGEPPKTEGTGTFSPQNTAP